MNLGEMVADVRERVGERTPNFWTNEFIKARLNAGQTRFAREEKWPWLFALQDNIPIAQGASTIELIDGVDLNRHFGLVLYKVGDTTPILPKRITTWAGLRLRAEARHTSVGEPQFWYPHGVVKNYYESGDPAEFAQTARLVPATDQAYTAEYYYLREPAKMVDDADQCDLPEAYHEAVVAWATAQCWLKELNGERKAQSEFNLYNVVLEQAIQDYKEQAQDHTFSWGGDPVDRPTPRDELLRRLFTLPLGNPT